MSSTFTHPLTEEDIANYLADTPDFFERHAELLATVLLSSPHSTRAVSLQERQASLLREKIKVLEHRIMDMIRNGSENAMLSERLMNWAGSLFRVNDPLRLPDQLAEQIAEHFSVPQVAIKVWDVAPVFAQAAFASGVSEDIKLFTSSLTEPFCGVNTGFEAAAWLAEPLAASSLAMLPLRAGPIGGSAAAFGLLVLASPDAQRFNSTMGTDFLARIAELASAALSRLR